MTGERVKSRWKVCWKFVSPLIILSVIIGGIVQKIRQIARGEFSYTAWDRDEVNQNVIRCGSVWFVLQCGCILLLRHSNLDTSSKHCTTRVIIHSTSAL